MDEHDDDLESEVEDGVEFEVEEFPILTDEDEAVDLSREQGGATQMELDIDPDKSEI